MSRVITIRDKGEAKRVRKLVKEAQHVDGVAAAVAIRPGLVRFTIPWGYLVSDNRKAGHGGKGRLGISRQYREGKKSLRELFAMLWPSEIFGGDVALFATMHAPAEYQRTRDQANFAKQTKDAMEGVVVINDSQIVFEAWARGAPEPGGCLSLYVGTANTAIAGIVLAHFLPASWDEKWELRPSDRGTLMPVRLSVLTDVQSG